MGFYCSEFSKWTVGVSAPRSDCVPLDILKFVLNISQEPSF